jgi:hypothetical protein
MMHEAWLQESEFQPKHCAYEHGASPLIGRGAYLWSVLLESSGHRLTKITEEKMMFILTSNNHQRPN